jgi:hypothetical protein
MSVERKVDRMKYWKNLQNMGAVKASEEKPTENGFWVEATEQDYIKFCMRISYTMASLKKAVAYKKRILRVDD